MKVFKESNVIREKKDDFEYAYNAREKYWQVIRWSNSVKRYHNTPEYFNTKKEAVEYCADMIIDWSAALKVISPEDNEFYINSTDYPELYDDKYDEKELKNKISKVIKDKD